MKFIVLLLFIFPLSVIAQEEPPAPDYVYKPFVKKTWKHLDKLKAEAEKNDTAAIAELAFTYYNWAIPGSSVQNWLQNNDKCAYWLHRGIALGHAQRCAYMLAVLFQEDDYRNSDSAFYFYQMAADRGSVSGMLALAKHYPHSDMRAMYWFDMAAKGGSAEAAEWIANINTAADSCFYRAAAALKKGDFVEAIRLWRIDAKVNSSKEAMYNLGLCYEKGYGVKADRQEATSWYDLACSVGMGIGCYRSALLDLSAGYTKTARESLNKAVKFGYKQAQQDIDDLDKQIAANDAEKKAWMDAYTKKLNDAANNPAPHTVTYTTPPAPATNYNVPAPSAAQRDQEMYDKMHKEQAQREKAYKDKWGN